MAKVMTVMQQAKSRFVLKNVFFASVVMATTIEESDYNGTAWTDMVKIGYNPAFIESLGDPNLVIFVLAHEIMHIILKHGLRRGSRDADLWNEACDYAINIQLKEAGFTIWDQALFDIKYANMSAEQIYEKRLSESKEGKGVNGNEPGSGRGKGKGIGRDLRAPPGASDPEQRVKIENTITQRVASAATQARLAGQMSAAMDRLVSSVLEPQVAWPDVLREYMTAMIADDETWSRRNRRFDRIVLPARWSETMGELVLVGDTSGSIGDTVFARIASELNYIVEAIKPERVRMIWADDADCSREEVFEPGEDIVLHPKGGGGTDMRKPLKYVEQFDPVCVILITDGYTPWPASPPPYPLITLMTTKHVCPHGVTIEVTV